MWTQLETGTHQDHVIKHVVGATVLGWLVAGEAAHFLLDIGFLWTVYLDGEMNLLPQGVALSELDADDLSASDKAELTFDAQSLLSEGRRATELKLFTAAPFECLITGVEVFGAEERRKIVISGETGNVEIETSLENSRVTITAD